VGRTDQRFLCAISRSVSVDCVSVLYRTEDAASLRPEVRQPDLCLYSPVSIGLYRNSAGGR
jgi:hypothetical protein